MKNYWEKFERCQNKGTQQCPNLWKMKTVSLREKKEGESIEFFTQQDLEADAKLCKNCEMFRA